MLKWRIGKRRGWTPVAALTVVVCFAHILSPVGTSGDITYCIVTVGSAVFALVAALQRPRGRRYPWVWIAAGLACSGVGDVWYTVLLWNTDMIVDASLADVFYLGSYVALATGLLAMIGIHRTTAPADRSRWRFRRRLDIDGLIDLGSFTIVSIIVISRVTDVGAIFTDHSISAIDQVVWAAYPVLDAALLAVLIRSMVSRRRLGRSGVLISLGIAGWLVSDYASLIADNLTAYSTWLNFGWMLGAVSMAAAVYRRPADNSSEAVAVWLSEPDRVGGARVLISLVPLLVPGAIQTWAYFQRETMNPVPLLVSTVALVLLALARSTRLVGARDRQAAQLERSERYYQALAENSADAVIVVDGFGRIVGDATNLAAMLGTPGVITDGTDALSLVDPDDRDRVRAVMKRIHTTDGVVHDVELRTRHADGSQRWFALRAVNMVEDPAIGGLIVNIHDVTDRKRAEAELTHRAFHDSLTGLANRALFHDRVEHALQRTMRSSGEIAVVYLDIDGFKMVNDSRGHESGDHVLREISARLLAAVRTADTVARLGGDEFAILVEQSLDPLSEAIQIADRVLDALTAAISLEDQQVVLSASIGIAVGDTASTASSMLRDADVAMYRAKTGGKARWTVYHPDMRAAVVERLDVETDLLRALPEQQFRLVYQPIIELATERIAGFEALVRWHHPTRGVIAPDAFVPIAEENGSIVAIGEWVLDQACQTGAEWQRRYPDRVVTMAVNLSTRQIATPGIVEHVRSSLSRSGLDPSSLVLEMTETVLVQDPALASTRLHELRALGVKLAIDDFGTGYSSLSYLRQFPVDILKIDRSFISGITDRDEIPAIVRGLLDLGKTLALETVAEGVERSVQRDSLRDQRCTYGQGFLFAQPLSETDAGELLESIADAGQLIGSGR